MLAAIIPAVDIYGNVHRKCNEESKEKGALHQEMNYWSNALQRPFFHRYSLFFYSYLNAQDSPLQSFFPPSLGSSISPRCGRIIESSRQKSMPVSVEFFRRLIVISELLLASPLRRSSVHPWGETRVEWILEIGKMEFSEVIFRVSLVHVCVYDVRTR